MKLGYNLFSARRDTQLRMAFLLILSILLFSVGFSGLAVAQSSDIAADTEVSPNGTVEVVLTPTDVDNQLTVSGELAGWTVEEMSPNNAFTSPSDLPAESEDGDNWATVGEYSAGEWSIVVSPPNSSSVSDSFTFDVEETDGQGNQVASDSFTIDIVEDSGNTGEDDEPDSNTGNITSDEQVAPGGTTDLVFTPNDEGNTLSISGDVAGWTVESLSPDSTFTSPQPGTELGEGENIGTVGAYSDGEFIVTVSPPAGATNGETYSFEVEELDGQDNRVALKSFTVEVTETVPVPDWVNQRDISADQYRAFDTDQSGNLNGDEIRTGVGTYISSLPSGEVNGENFTGDDIRTLVNGYINNELTL